MQTTDKGKSETDTGTTASTPTQVESTDTKGKAELPENELSKISGGVSNGRPLRDAY
jgi:bacteriocin-like protein